MKSITKFINEGKYAKSVVETTIADYVAWWTGAGSVDEVLKDEYYDDLKSGAEGNGMWVFGPCALKSQFGGNFDKMYKFLIAEVKKKTAIDLVQAELGDENVAIFFTLGDYVFDTTATGEFDGK